MKDLLDICIPVWRNLKCLRVAAKGLAYHLADKTSIRKILLYVQDPQERDEAERAFKMFSLDVVGIDIIPIVGPPTKCMDAVLNGLFAETKAPWVIFMEQDTFVHVPVDSLAKSLEEDGYIVGGPVDTYHYDNPHARGQPLYGQYGRLSPEPGYYHSSMVLLKREEALTKSSTPFTIPAGFKMHGTGVLGGEPYYGLRIHVGEDRSKLAFFRQAHASCGYAADISWKHFTIATHLFYSSTKPGYRDSGFLKPTEYDWLCSEEDRFLHDYEQSIR